MVKETDALQEFAEKWRKILKESKDPNVNEMFMAHFTALISEHYCPKEEIVNAVCPSCESDNCVLIAIPRNRCKDCGVEWDKENER